MAMAIRTERKAQNALSIETKFRDSATLTEEQLTDPDYRLKQLAKHSGGKISITCSKCHHCR